MQMMRTNHDRIIYMGYENQTMRLQFDDGSLYEYYGVPQSVFAQFQASPTKDSFLSQYIRGHYAYKRL